MLSRVAERVYWFARYIERAENSARLLLVHHNLLLDLPKSVELDWGYLIDVLGAKQEFEKTKLKPTEKNVTTFLYCDRNYSGSIISSITAARENIRTTREVMPSETWEQVNSLYLSIARRANRGLPRSQRHKALNKIISDCQRVVGLLAGTMNNDDAYRFIRMGRNFERADMSARIVDAGTNTLLGDYEEVQPYNNVIWIAVLRSLSAYQMYRLSVRRKVIPEEVLKFFLQSTVFPRAMAHCLIVLEETVLALSNHDDTLLAVKVIRKTLSEVDANTLVEDNLHQFIDELQLQLAEIHRKIGKTWFNHED